ncbi:MAG: hypothetical protein FWH41_11025, partial [Treponema sp.]|nr:hypothetical protein [Treponema sp.]
MEAVKYPLTVVSAGTGYGKSYAVQDFLEEYEAATVWIQLSERDNVPARFWEIFTHIVAQVDVSFYKAIIKLGFPNTGEKLDQYMALLHNYTKMQRQIIVLDDFHFIEEPSVIRFLEQSVHNMPVGTSVFLVSRSSPHINTANLILKNCLFTISESDLRFTENELAQYFNQLSISLHPDCLYKIMQDTQGWAFAIKLIAHSYQKVPGYEGYSRSAMRSNIFQFMQKGIWNEISPELKSFLTCLSLIDHLSFDLIELLAAENRELVSEMEQLSDYIRLDRFANVYRIHHLFLEFLSQKQENLPAQLITDTYKITGRWCRENGFLIDAISYFEKIGDYSSIVSIFSSMPAHIPADFAKFAAEILDRAPEAAFETVELLVESHLRVYISLGLWEKSNVLMKRYETKFLKIPMEVSSAEAASAGDTFNQMTLSSLYYSWGYMRHFLCTTDDCYDFDFYFEKYCQYKSKPSAPGKFANYCPGPWINCAGSSRKDALEDYIAALDRMAACVTFHFNGFKSGKAELARGELKFYQGDLRAAEFHIFNAL